MFYALFFVYPQDPRRGSRPRIYESCNLFSGAKLEHMIALRDEVELEYADRMEDLREMYRSEMDSQNEKFEAEKSKLRMLEASLQVKKS